MSPQCPRGPCTEVQGLLANWHFRLQLVGRSFLELPRVLLKEPRSADDEIVSTRRVGVVHIQICSGGLIMSDSIHFEATSAFENEHPVCPLCGENVIEFEFHFSSEARPIEQLSGRCCLSCAVALLDAMRALSAAGSDDREVVMSPRVPHNCSKYVN